MCNMRKRKRPNAGSNPTWCPRSFYSPQGGESTIRPHKNLTHTAPSMPAGIGVAATIPTRDHHAFRGGPMQNDRANSGGKRFHTAPGDSSTTTETISQTVNGLRVHLAARGFTRIQGRVRRLHHGFGNRSAIYSICPGLGKRGAALFAS